VAGKGEEGGEGRGEAVCGSDNSFQHRCGV
jgi:hypothetical protein